MYLKIFIRHYWKSILALLFILYLSFAPPSTFKKVPTFEDQDKVIHFLLYYFLTIVFIYDFRNHIKDNANTFTFVLACILFPCLIGGLVEVLQPTLFAPRTGSFGDFYADIMGVFMGWTTMFYRDDLRKKD